MRRNQRLFLLASTIMGLVPLSSAYAAEEDDQSGNDIVVTARRVEERLQDVPISISVYNQQQLENRNIVTAADLGTYTPSVSTNSRYGSDKATFAIRGFVQDLGTAPSVGTYFAEVVGPRGADPTGGGDGVGVGNLFDLQNVQILKGPQGTLFGRNTTGGAVLLVPTKPTRELEGYVEGSIGNYAMKRIQGVLNIPLSETFRVRLGVDHQTRDGYEINKAPGGPNPPAFADVDYTALRLSIVADLTPNLENYTIATYSNSNTRGVLGRIEGCVSQSTLGAIAASGQTALAQQMGIGFFYGCAQLARQNARGDSPWDVESSNPLSGIKSTQWQVINTTSWTASDTLTVKNIAAYSELRYIDRFAVGGDNFINPLIPGATKPDLTLIFIANTPGYHNSAQSTFSDELQFQGRALDDKLQWQAGGYLELSNPIGVTSQFVTAFLNCTNAYALQCAGKGAISNSYTQTWYRNTGLYAQATYDVTDKLSLTGGLRYTWDVSRQHDVHTAIAFPAPNFPYAVCSDIRSPQLGQNITPGSYQRCTEPTYEAKSHAPTWVINADYKLSDAMMVYAKYSRGYRAGGVNATIPYFETWKPEKVDAYEIGAKTSFAGAVSGYFNVAGFYNNFTNQQLQAGIIPAPGSNFVGGSGIVNAGKSRIWGVEVDTAVTFFDDFRIEAGYTYLNTRLTSIIPPVVPAAASGVVAAVIPSAIVGSSLALSPRNKFSITGTWMWSFLDPKVGKVSLGATWTHQDSQIASQSSIPGTNFGTLPASNLINLNLNWVGFAGLPVDVNAFVTNVANKFYPVNITNLGAAYGFESYIPNEPRMFGARVKVHF